MKKLIVENDGANDISLYDLEVEVGDGISAATVMYSASDHRWTMPGAVAGRISIDEREDRLEISLGDGTEFVLDWSQIEMMNMLYTAYNRYLKEIPSDLDMYGLENDT